MTLAAVRSFRLTVLLTAMSGAFAAASAAQEAPISSGYPTRDVLSPFRDPAEIAAPPDALFAQLRIMRQLADDAAAVRSFDADGREVLDNDDWKAARAEAERIGIDAGVLAVQMRSNRNPDERALAFYGAFYCANVDYVFNLIGHIPGEPVRRTRELAYPRAIAYLKANIGRRFGDLPKEQQAAIVASLPKVGSPAAKARGITREPRGDDLMHSVNLVPFFQLLDLDEPMDQAQGLWFLKECFAVRRDLALMWLEPALPRVRQLLRLSNHAVRSEALGLFAAIADSEQKLPVPKLDDVDAVEAFAEAVSKAMFPPVRRVAEGRVLLLPGEERDALVKAGEQALSGDTIGAPAHGKTSGGIPWRGFRIDRVPAGLEPFGVPEGAVITAINGVPVNDGKSLLAVIDANLWYLDRSSDKEGVRRRKPSTTLVVEMQVGDETKAIDYVVK